ncbi:hypothetical protein [Microbulbifer variabilis]|uniref:hypothetical protein n=1 Tax=Microbulbifer variabilis TaxID=266805 RepID=UPI0003A28C66|nr:hypothetical protein [Microbulbifer variabilis]
MKEIFSALNISCYDYDWFVSDIEANGLVISEGWYPGLELEKIITSNDVQFIWAVFSAFPIGTRFVIAEPPYVDGNPNYWNASEPKPQLEKAIFEIACWDSSATILIGVNQAMAENFKSMYTGTKELKDAVR